MKKEFKKIAKKIIAYLVTFFIILFWLLVAILGTFAKKELMISGDGTTISNFIVFLPVNPLALMIITLAIVCLKLVWPQIKVTSSRYFSLNCLLISMFYCSLGIAGSIKNGLVEYEKGIHLIGIPLAANLALFNNIPGFFPIYNDFFSIIKDLLLNIIAISFIYVLLIVFRDSIIKLFSYAGNILDLRICRNTNE